MEKVMISIIVVNHNSSAFLKKCFSSIVSTIGNEPFEIFIVDSGSSEEDVTNLRDLEGNNIHVILNKDNIGYAKAVNKGAKNAKGDFILITNPDVIYKPGSLKCMSDALGQLPRCGAVGPKTWWNETMTFLLPFSELVTPMSTLQKGLVRISPLISDIVFKRWIKKAIKFWLSGKPLRQKMLSGACIMTTKRVLDTVGVFDETFSLYFEDTDWCQRAIKAGYHLYMIPEANIVHYYNQSAKQDRDASLVKFYDSMGKYMEKHFNLPISMPYQGLKLLKYFPVKVSRQFDDMGIFADPPVFSFSNKSKKLLLLSPEDSLIPSAGSFLEGDSFAIPNDLWGCMAEGRYYVRVYDLNTLGKCCSWSWVKHHSK